LIVPVARIDPDPTESDSALRLLRNQPPRRIILSLEFSLRLEKARLPARLGIGNPGFGKAELGSGQRGSWLVGERGENSGLAIALARDIHGMVLFFAVLPGLPGGISRCRQLRSVHSWIVARSAHRGPAQTWARSHTTRTVTNCGFTFSVTAAIDQGAFNAGKRWSNPGSFSDPFHPEMCRTDQQNSPLNRKELAVQFLFCRSDWRQS